jgi:hypothetical protein
MVCGPGSGRLAACLRLCASRSESPTSAAMSAVVLGTGDKLSPVRLARLVPTSALTPKSASISSRSESPTSAAMSAVVLGKGDNLSPLLGL